MLGPPDIERIVGITGGNIFHGEILPDQMFGNRPVPGYTGYQTPVEGLYLCGSGAWPGGAVFGAPGRNCANAGAPRSRPVEDRGRCRLARRCLRAFGNVRRTGGESTAVGPIPIPPGRART